MVEAVAGGFPLRFAALLGLRFFFFRIDLVAFDAELETARCIEILEGAFESALGGGFVAIDESELMIRFGGPQFLGGLGGVESGFDGVRRAACARRTSGRERRLRSGCEPERLRARILRADRGVERRNLRGTRRRRSIFRRCRHAWWWCWSSRFVCRRP